MEVVVESKPESNVQGLMTYEEAAKFLGVSVSRVRQLAGEEGKPLKKVIVDGHPHLLEEDVRRYAESRRPYRRRGVTIRRRRKAAPQVEVIVQRLIEDAETLKAAIERYDEDVRASIAEQIRKAK